MAKVKKNPAKKGKSPVGPEMTIAEIITKYPETIQVFLSYGLHCFGCIGASFENLRQAAKTHGANLDSLIRDLKTVIEGRKEEGGGK